MLDGWEVAGWEPDVQTVAESYPWGAHRIVHSETTAVHCSCATLYTTCECSWGSGRVYSTQVVAGVTEYKTIHRDRILIRQLTVESTTFSPSPASPGTSVSGDPVGANVQPLAVVGDPITWYHGKKTKFWFPPGELLPFLETPEITVWASTFFGGPQLTTSGSIASW